MNCPRPSIAPQPRIGGEDETAEVGDDDRFGPRGHGMHVHHDDQFIVAVSGSAVIDVDGEQFAVNQSTGVWIPAGFVHSAHFRPGFAPFAHRTGSPTRVVSAPRSVVVTEELRNRLLATSISGANASPILHAVLAQEGRNRAVREDDTPVSPSNGEVDATRTQRRAEVERLARAELNGPLTAAISAALHADPADDRTLDSWARRLHTSTTSIRRAFVAELGTSYSAWRTAVRLEAAAALLRRGYPVANAARAVGFTHNGLLAAFHRGYGCQPSAMRQRSM